MKKLLLIILFLIPSIFLVSPSFAQEGNNGPNTVVLPQNEVVNNDYFASGGTVILSGTVNGDAYLAGSNIVVEGTVNGDLLAVGGTVEIRGTVASDARVIGGQVNVSGNSSIGRNFSVVGGQVNLSDGAVLGGNVTVASGNFSVFAPVTGNINASSGQITLGNTIGGEVNANVGRLVLTPSVNIAGNLNYTSTTPAEIQPGATVRGQITQNQPSGAPEPQKVLGIFVVSKLLIQLFSFLGALIVGLLLLRFLPGITLKIAEAVYERPWLSLGLGLLTLIVFPIIFIILLVTVIGIPLALILLVIFLVALYLTKIFVSITIGKIIFGWFNQKVSVYWALIAGLIIYYLVTLIPVVGGIIALLVATAGLGAVLLSREYLFRRSKD